jgi:N-acetyl-anhydromuramyl-L-alanine amidase AmpD
MVGLNLKGIGVCLVGNFSLKGECVSAAQMDSLVYLVNLLRNYYNIPSKNILGHSQVSGARTECPGKCFPWADFWKNLNNK